MKTMFLVLIAILLAGCDEGASEGGGDGDSDSDGDTDSDTDSDAGSDTDTDTDTEEDYDTDCDEGCTQPPPDICDEEGNLFEYTGASSCIENVCEYEYETIACGYDCVETGGDDYCMDSICDGVVCNDPPDNECDTTHLLIVYEETEGSCDSDTGECYYSWDWESCPNECIVVSGADDYCS